MTEYCPEMRVGEYVLIERVGVGSFGEVWRARHSSRPDDQVAVKLPTEPQYVRYIQREGAMVHGLRHPNIVRVIGLDPFAERPYLVMELIRGPSLKQLIEQSRGGIPVGTVVTVLKGVLRALEAAHGANLLHRDVKPGNILLNLAGRPLDELRVEDVKVGDFDLGLKNAEALSSITQSASLERENTIAGTLAYMAPEVRDGRMSADALSDLYSVGVVLFEMLTGERPVGGEPPSSVRASTPAALDEVFRRLYARHINRYQNATAALADLDERLQFPLLPADEAAWGPNGPPAELSPPDARQSAPPPPRPAAPRPPKAAPLIFGIVLLAIVTAMASWVVRCGSQNANMAPFTLLRSPASSRQISLDLGSGQKLELVLVPAGEFLMGSPESERQRESNEGPQHRVRLTRPFYLGQHQVTQAEWRAVMGNNPSKYTGEDLPVDSVSWNDCQDFCRKLNRRLQPGDSAGGELQVRLPTEAEWEYACRGRTITPFHLGQTISTRQANYDGGSVYGSGRKGEDRGRPTPVESFQANALGLFDLHGNVSEWCQDYFALYPAGDQIDPTGPGNGWFRVVRGGAWSDPPTRCRSAHRAMIAPDSSRPDLGFRVAVSVRGDTRRRP